MSTKRWFKFFIFNIFFTGGAFWQNHLLLDMIVNLGGWLHHKVEKATLGLQIIWHILPSQQIQMSIQK
jgi:hypothetical protein